MDALPTPARSATPSMVMPARPVAITISLAALRIAFSVPRLRGLPRRLSGIELTTIAFQYTKRDVPSVISSRRHSDGEDQTGTQRARGIAHRLRHLAAGR